LPGKCVGFTRRRGQLPETRGTTCDWTTSLARCWRRRSGFIAGRVRGCSSRCTSNLLEKKLQQRGLRVESQVGIDFTYDSIEFKDGFRIDLLVERSVILEVKSLERGLAAVHTKQLLTYLRLTDLRVGLVLNFGGATMKEGIKRVVNDLPPSESSVLCVNREE
jgi:iron complex transport system substrate-binding protein